MKLPHNISWSSVCHTMRVVVTTCSRTLVVQITVLMDVKAM